MRSPLGFRPTVEWTIVRPSRSTRADLRRRQVERRPARRGRRGPSATFRRRSRSASQRDGDGRRRELVERPADHADQLGLELLGGLGVGRGGVVRVEAKRSSGFSGLTFPSRVEAGVVDAEEPLAPGRRRRRSGWSGCSCARSRTCRPRAGRASRAGRRRPSSDGNSKAIVSSVQSLGARRASSAAGRPGRRSRRCRCRSAGPRSSRRRSRPGTCAETITTGAATLIRWSSAVSRNVCVPPPDSPVHAHPGGVDVGQRQGPVEGADAVPGLQAWRGSGPSGGAGRSGTRGRTACCRRSRPCRT